MKFILRHKETNHEIYRQGGYYFERVEGGHYMRMEDVPQWIIEYDLQKTKEKSSKYKTPFLETFANYFPHNKAVNINSIIASICKDHPHFESNDELVQVAKNVDIGITNDSRFIQCIEISPDVNIPIKIGVLNGCDIYLDYFMKSDNNKIIDHESLEPLDTIDDELLSILY